MKAAATEPEIRTISAAEFKAKCLQLMDEVNEKKLTLIITKRGKPVMQAIAPVTEIKPSVPLWGRSPGIKLPPDFSEFKAKLALDWADPSEKLPRTSGAKRKKHK